MSEELDVHVLIRLQAFTYLPNNGAKEIICRVSDLQVFLHAQFERQFDQVERVPHYLIGEESGVLGQKLHSSLHHASVVDLVDGPHHSFQDEEQALELALIEGATGLQTERKPPKHPVYRLKLGLILPDVLLQHHEEDALCRPNMRLDFRTVISLEQ